MRVSYTSASVLAIAVIWSSTAIPREVPVDGSTSGYVRYSSESRIAAMETSLNTKGATFNRLSRSTVRLVQNDSDLSSIGNPAIAPLKWAGLLSIRMLLRKMERNGVSTAPVNSSRKGSF